MNCLTARETLDLAHSHDARPHEVRPQETGWDELQGATIDEAARHLRACPACQVAVRRREQIDERIGQLSRDVAVPMGLRERLLTRLEAAHLEAAGIEVASGPIVASPFATSGARDGNGGLPNVTQANVTLPAVRSRRWLMAAAVAACVVVVSGAGVWRLMLPDPASLSLNEIAEYALSASVNPAILPVMTQFQGGLDLQPPKTMPRMQPFRRLVDPQMGDREIAVYFFTYSGRMGGAKFKGRLVVVPAAAVKDLPAASAFPGQPLYKLGYCTTAWVEGKFVYLCCVRGGENELLLLRPASSDPA